MSGNEAFRNNLLLALPPLWRPIPPVLLAVVGAAILLWLDAHAAGRYASNLAPFVWCLFGVALMIRPLQPLALAAAAWGMAGLASRGAADVLASSTAGFISPMDAARVALWSAIVVLAVPAAVFESLDLRRSLGRRLFFTAGMLFFLEQGFRHALVSGNGSESVPFFLIAAMAAVGIGLGIRSTTALPATVPPRVHYLE